jgi:glycosyltransferase involved in cell wall biosynthesis
MPGATPYNANRAIYPMKAANSAASSPRVSIAVIGIRGIPASYGGFETCADHLARLWAAEGHDVLVYCRKHHYRARPSSLDGIRLKYTPSIAWKSLDTLSHTFLSILDLLLHERRTTVVHLYNTGNGICLPLLKLFGKKVVVTADGLEWKRAKWGGIAKLVHKIGEALASRFADQIVSDNDEIQKYYERAFGLSTRMIPYGAKLVERNCERSAAALQKHGLRENEYFLFVGRLVPEKGVHELIRAYMTLDTTLPLVIIGDDTAESDYRNELFGQQSERVRMLGFIYGEEYEHLLANARAYVSASRLEGTSPSLLAAMGARVCALVNGIKENRAAVGDAAVMFEADDFDDLAAKWRMLLEQPHLCEEMAEKGYGFVAENYRWSAVAARYLKVFADVTVRPEPASEPWSTEPPLSEPQVQLSPGTASAHDA